MYIKDSRCALIVYAPKYITKSYKWFQIFSRGEQFEMGTGEKTPKASKQTPGNGASDPVVSSQPLSGTVD
jgi:hypothetical protein